VRHKPVVNNYPLDLEKLVLLRPDIVFTVEGITSVDDAQRLQEWAFRCIPRFAR
jgi:iron complex transport system substrate-binding protein